MAKRLAAWELLVERGFVEDRKGAEALIMAGKVRLDERPVLSAGQRVPGDGALWVKGADMPYVSKGGLKLEGALRDFGLDVAGRVCLDAGASTGGFTDCLVQHGAALVYAVDVGFGQLAGSLRNHARVRNLEQTNLGDEKLLGLEPRPSLGTADLSYLSLEKAVPLYGAILGQGDLICLVKPLFEIEDMAARRSGQVPDEALVPLLAGLCRRIRGQGHGVMGVTHSPVTGNHGTREFFLHVALGQGEHPLPSDDAIEQAVEQALLLIPYQK